MSIVNNVTQLTKKRKQQSKDELITKKPSSLINKRKKESKEEGNSTKVSTYVKKTKTAETKKLPGSLNNTNIKTLQPLYPVNGFRKKQNNIINSEQSLVAKPNPFTEPAAPTLYIILDQADTVYLKWKGAVIPEIDRNNQVMEFYRYEVNVSYGNTSFSLLDTISISQSIDNTNKNLLQTFSFPVIDLLKDENTTIKLTMQVTGSNGITSYDSNVVSYGQKNYWVNVALPLYANQTIVEENTDALRSFIGGTQRVYFPINYVNA